MIIAIFHYKYNGISYDVQYISHDEEQALADIQAWNDQNYPNGNSHSVTILCDTFD